MLICAAHGYPGEGRPDVETFVGAKLPFGELLAVLDWSWVWVDCEIDNAPLGMKLRETSIMAYFSRMSQSVIR